LQVNPGIYSWEEHLSLLEWALALLTNIKLGLGRFASDKGSSLSGLLVSDEEKGFMKLTRVIIVIKLFHYHFPFEQKNLNAGCLCQAFSPKFNLCSYAYSYVVPFIIGSCSSPANITFNVKHSSLFILSIGSKYQILIYISAPTRHSPLKSSSSP
jgi:hypothetical protein